MKGRIVRFLDNEDPTGSDKSAIRTSLEVSPDAAGLVQADVGTAPNEIPVNGMLGDMAYQSSDGVSAAKLEVESTTGTATTQALTVTDGSSTNFVVQEDGNVGIGNNSPSSYHPSADDLVVGDTSGHRGMTIVSGSGNSGSIYFADGTSGDALYRGYIGYNQGSNLLNFGTAATTQWQINNSGNLVAYAAGVGIDFGSGATLDDYEVGTWTPAYTTTGSGFTTPPTMEVLNARYVRIGDLVTFYAHIRTDSVDLTGAGTFLLVNGLPYAATASSGLNRVPINVGQAVSWNNAPAGGYIDHGQSYIYLTKRTTSITGSLTSMPPSDLTSGTVANQNELMISGSYYTNA